MAKLTLLILLLLIPAALTDDLQIATTLNETAVAYHTQGRYSDAVPLLQRALSISERLLTPGDPNIAIVANNLAGNEIKLGKFADAEILLKRALSILDTPSNPDKMALAATLSNL